MKKRYFKLTVLSLFMLSTFSIRAQFSSDLYQKMKNEYATEGRVMLYKGEELDLRVKKGKIITQHQVKEQIIYLKKASLFNSSLGTYESSFYKLDDFSANSYTLENGKYKKNKVKEFSTSSNAFNDVFFDDTKNYDFTFSGVSDGSIVELITEHSLDNIRFLPSVFVQSYIPVEEFYFKVTADNDIDLKFLERNFNGLTPHKKEVKGKKRTVYEWRFDNLSAFKKEDYAPAIKYNIMQIIPIVKSALIGGKQEFLHDSPKDLYRYYFDFIKDLKKDINTTDLEKIAVEITKDCKTDFEKVTKVYQWAQENIKYIAFEDGMGGFIPRKSDEVCRKKYGDCKDNSNVMHDMLDLLGIETHLTWIGTRRLPYRYSELPTLQTDNHMILTYINNGKYHFLDATGRYLTPDLPSGFIQGKEALLAFGKDSFQIVEVPVIPALKNAIRDSLELSFSGRNLKGKGKTSFSGFPKINVNYRMEGLKDEKFTTEIENIIEKGSNKFKLTSTPKLSGTGYNDLLKVDYEFAVDDFIQEVENEYYVNLNLTKRFTSLKLEDDRKSSFVFENTHFQESHFVLEIPENFEVVSLPKSSSFDDTFLSFNSDYRIEKNKIVFYQKITIDTIEIKPKDFDKWKRFRKALARAYSQTIVLKKKTL